MCYLSFKKNIYLQKINVEYLFNRQNHGLIFIHGPCLIKSLEENDCIRCFIMCTVYYSAIPWSHYITYLPLAAVNHHGYEGASKSNDLNVLFDVCTWPMASSPENWRNNLIGWIPQIHVNINNSTAGHKVWHVYMYNLNGKLYTLYTCVQELFWKFPFRL